MSFGVASGTGSIGSSLQTDTALWPEPADPAGFRQLLRYALLSRYALLGQHDESEQFSALQPTYNLGFHLGFVPIPSPVSVLDGARTTTNKSEA